MTAVSKPHIWSRAGLWYCAWSRYTWQRGIGRDPSEAFIDWEWRVRTGL